MKLYRILLVISIYAIPCAAMDKPDLKAEQIRGYIEYLKERYKKDRNSKRLNVIEQLAKNPETPVLEGRSDDSKASILRNVVRSISPKHPVYWPVQRALIFTLFNLGVSTGYDVEKLTQIATSHKDLELLSKLPKASATPLLTREESVPSSLVDSMELSQSQDYSSITSLSSDDG